MDRKLTKKQIEKLATEIRAWLIRRNLWVDTTIYFNGKAFSTSDGKGYYYNDPEHLIVLENEDPAKCVGEYVGTVLTITTEGDFCGCLNFYGEYGSQYDLRIQEEFSDILDKYGCYYELGYHWSIAVYYK